MKRKLMVILGLLVIASMLLSACATAPAAAPAAEQPAGGAEAADGLPSTCQVCSQDRKRPGRALRGDTLDARLIIVDACGGQTTTAPLRNVYADTQHVDHRQPVERPGFGGCGGKATER